MPLVVVYDKGAVSPLDILRKAPAPLVVVLGPSAHAQRMRPLFADSCVGVHDLAEDGLVGALGGRSLAGIQTFSEPMLPATAELATALGLPFHDENVVELLTNKDAQRRRLREAGVDDTISQTLTDAALWDATVAGIGLPVVVKPARGVGSRNTVLVDDATNGRSMIGSIIDEEGAVVVEEYLAGIEVPEPWGDYVSVESVVQSGAIRHLAITGKLRLAPPFRECGQYWPSRLAAASARDVLALADGAVKSLNVVSGMLHTEIKLTPRGPRVIEVNGRVGGFIPEMASHAAGIDLVNVGLRIARGEHVELPLVDPDRVHLQFTTPAPVDAGVVTKVCRHADLDGVPGVVGYTPLVRRGDAVGGYGTQDLNLVTVEAADHDALATAIDMILDRIEFEFELGGRRFARSARQLIYDTPENNQ